MAVYILQMFDGGYLDDFVNTTRECIEQQKWLTGEQHDVVYSKTGDSFSYAPDNTKTVVVSVKNGFTLSGQPLIPVGSVEFVESFLRRHYKKDGITPINIPTQLMEERFTGRMVAYANRPSEVEETFFTWGATHLFVKRTDRCKSAPAGIYRPGEKGYAAPGASYFVSETLDFEAEWRVFVFHKKIRDVRCYSGNPWRLPNEKLVIDMVDSWSGAPPSYTLDVGVTSTGSTVVVETHNFVSCGLYGFADATILPQMTSAGFKHEAGLLHRTEFCGL